MCTNLFFDLRKALLLFTAMVCQGNENSELRVTRAQPVMLRRTPPREIQPSLLDSLKNL